MMISIRGVEWRLQAFRYTNVLNGFRQVRTLVLILLGKVRPKFSELHEWAQHAAGRVPDDLDHAGGTEEPTRPAEAEQEAGP
jgi:hypothetical protein